MEQKEAAAVCGQAAATLTQVMSNTSDAFYLRALSQGLSAVAASMEQKEAAAVCGQAAATLTQVMSNTRPRSSMLELSQGLLAVVARMEPKEAAVAQGQAAGVLLQAMSKTTEHFELYALSQGLSLVLAPESTKRGLHRAVGAAATVGLGTFPGSLPLVPVALEPALAPLPEPLPVQTVVDLLKHPLCVGEARWVILKTLGSRYQRTFADQWEFVRFAQEQKLGVDLITPPDLPGRVADRK
jgi:hypothetical protein